MNITVSSLKKKLQNKEAKINELLDENIKLREYKRDTELKTRARLRALREVDKLKKKITTLENNIERARYSLQGGK